MINIEDFDSNLLKINKSSYKNIGIYYIGHITRKQIDHYENIYSVNHLFLIIGKVDGFIRRKKWKYLNLILQIKTKKYEKNTQNFGMGLKMKLRH